MDFIFMLTRDDRTVPDSLAVIRVLGVARAAGADAFTVGSAALGDDPAAGVTALRARLAAFAEAARAA